MLRGLLSGVPFGHAGIEIMHHRNFKSSPPFLRLCAARVVVPKGMTRAVCMVVLLVAWSFVARLGYGQDSRPDQKVSTQQAGTASPAPDPSAANPANGDASNAAAPAAAPDASAETDNRSAAKVASLVAPFGIGPPERKLV